MTLATKTILRDNHDNNSSKSQSISSSSYVSSSNTYHQQTLSSMYANANLTLY